MHGLSQNKVFIHKRGNKVWGLCKDFYTRGGKQAATERNIRIKKDMCSTRKMRVSDDEGYNDRCDESTSQDLGVNAVSHVRKNNAEGRNIPRRRFNDQSIRRC